MIMTVLTQEPLTLARRGVALYGDVEQRVVAVLRRAGLTVLRVSLGVVFVWFGALKVANMTPVGDLVAGTLPFLDPTWFVPFLGAVEVALGLALLIGGAITVVCAALVAHLCGTFLVLVMQPELAFRTATRCC
jgi:putative oxidoreductase